MDKNQIKELYNALENSRNTVTITGAGISIAAGGVTYSGMRTRSGPRGRRGMSGDPDTMYEYFYSTFLKPLFEHGPTEAHKALAVLEKMGKMQGIITTNVDCLHTKAGSKNVAEIQGSFQVNVCTGCAKRFYGYEMWNEGKMPTCDSCGSILLPFNIYSHAGLLAPELSKAQDWMRRADLILIVGATGCYTHTYWECRKRDAGIIQINPGKTYFDGVADLNIREGSDPVFKALMDLYDEP